MILETSPSPFAAWESYYVIVGSSGAGLIGLQFVVMALIADTNTSGSPDTIRAFGTPTIAHFGAALLISATMSAPWPSIAQAAWVLKLAAVIGLGLVLIAARTAVQQVGYKPVWEDWLWHTILPVIAYGTLLVAAIKETSSTTGPLFAIAGAALLLLFIGIHNAWDTVTYIVLTRMRGEPENREPPP
jgi:hypothetical protein